MRLALGTYLSIMNRKGDASPNLPTGIGPTPRKLKLNMRQLPDGVAEQFGWKAMAKVSVG